MTPDAAAVRQELASYRPLAVSILHDAALRATGRVRCSRGEQQEAQDWLSTPSPALAFWCRLAGARMQVVIRTARAGQLTPPAQGHRTDLDDDEAEERPGRSATSNPAPERRGQ